MAFSHFVLQETACHHSISNNIIPGTAITSSKGNNSTIVLFDPMTHTLRGKSGLGDHGLDGIWTFIEQHQCSPICRAIGLCESQALKVTFGTLKTGAEGGQTFDTDMESSESSDDNGDDGVAHLWHAAIKKTAGFDILRALFLCHRDTKPPKVPEEVLEITKLAKEDLGLSPYPPSRSYSPFILPEMDAFVTIATFFNTSATKAEDITIGMPPVDEENRGNSGNGYCVIV
ncbi:hypothetical protein HGRIS_003273 [Hohenbuehelia grisea]|uniref:Alpha-type protein kinase domain-containing protein n=1 Tax=Hohenbuehelia grisea TaxID=104357 RepID=A0ABR3JN69_9AGAR